MDEKELALAVNFGKAPADLQSAAKASADLYKQIRKLTTSQADTAAQIVELQKQAGVADKNLRKLLAAWDLTTLEVKA